MAVTDIVVAGYAETRIEFASGRTAYDLGGEVLASLLVATGIEKGAIDGVSVTSSISEASNNFVANFMCDALGLAPTWLNCSSLGGASVVAGVARAASAIRDGACEVALVLSADAPSTVSRQVYGAYRGEFQDPVGVLRPPAAFGLLMSRYDHQFGLRPEALAKIAVTQRAHGLMNENAYPKLRKPLTEADYLASRMIADPLRLLDCVMYCDGANALLVTAEVTARRFGLKKMARIAGYAERTNHDAGVALPDVTETGFTDVARRLFTRTGLRPSSIRMFHPYDDFTIAVLMQLEAFGFCARGTGSDYVLATDLSLSGPLPLNTGGGQLSAGQPGLAGGGVPMVEAVRQLFGDAGPRQVSNPTNALVTGLGVIPYAGSWATSAALILET
jgi:acetyl-CoA acetyltransferase